MECVLEWGEESFIETEFNMNANEVIFRLMCYVVLYGQLKLLIIVGTRPEIIRLASVINECRKYFDTLLAHKGQNYDYNLNGVFFKDLKFAYPHFSTLKKVTVVRTSVCLRKQTAGLWTSSVM